MFFILMSKMTTQLCKAGFFVALQDTSDIYNHRILLLSYIKMLQLPIFLILIKSNRNFYYIIGLNDLTSPDGDWSSDITTLPSMYGTATYTVDDVSRNITYQLRSLTQDDINGAIVSASRIN